MDKSAYLMAANVAVWLGIGFYLAFLGGVQRRLEKRLKRLEALREND